MRESGLLVKRDYERVTLEDGIVQYEVLLRDYRDVDGREAALHDRTARAGQYHDL